MGFKTERPCNAVMHPREAAPQSTGVPYNIADSTHECCLWVQIDKCFGFDTAVEEAQTALLAAKVESSSASQGIGLVKLMGRSSGFIAMQASMASGTTQPSCLSLGLGTHQP